MYSSTEIASSFPGNARRDEEVFTFKAEKWTNGNKERTAVKSSSSSLHVIRNFTFYTTHIEQPPLKKKKRKRTKGEEDRRGQREMMMGKGIVLTHWGCRIPIYLPYVIVASIWSCFPWLMARRIYRLDQQQSVREKREKNAEYICLSGRQKHYPR